MQKPEGLWLAMAKPSPMEKPTPMPYGKDYYKKFHRWGRVMLTDAPNDGNVEYQAWIRYQPVTILVWRLFLPR